MSVTTIDAEEPDRVLSGSECERHHSASVGEVVEDSASVGDNIVYQQTL